MKRERMLDRKLRRDVRRLWGPLLAVALVLASGIALFVTLRSMHGYLRGRQAAYYADYRFAELFVSLRRAPLALKARLAVIPGVERIDTRIVADVALDVPGLDMAATGRLISLPDVGEPALNVLHLRAGALPVADDEVAVSAAFAAANGLAPGDSIGAVLYGRWRRLRITGVVLSPEFIYEIRGGTDLFPDNRRFGVVWMREASLAAAFDLTGAFNDVVFTLRRGASAEEVIAGVDRLLARYGGLGAYGREDQLSHRFISDEIAETQVTSILVPSIFLAVTAFLVHLVLARLVAGEREQIAVLKAFGFGRGVVAAHYLQLAFVPVTFGAVLGAGLGLWLAGRLAGVYARFFQFPDVAFRADPTVLAAAVALAGGAGLVGALAAVSRVARLPPAEAMRPESPAVFRRGVLDRAAAALGASPPLRILLRNVERRPIKSALAVAGLASAVAIGLVSRYTSDAIDLLKEVQFQQVQREDVTVSFTNPESPVVGHELARLPGVTRVEGYRIVPVRLRYGHRTYRTGMLGLAPDGELRRIIGRDRRPVPLPENGLLLSATLAERIGATRGSVVTVEVLEGARPAVTLVVTGVVEELLGAAAYASAEQVRGLLREGPILSGAYLAVEADRMPALQRRLMAIPGIGGVAVRSAVLRGFEKTVAESFAITLTVTILFAAVIASGVVYNHARIALAERARELASLRVLGFTRGEVATMLLGEQALLLALAIPAGFLAGYGLCFLIVSRFTSDLFRLPLVLRPASFLFAAGVVVVAAVLSAVSVRRRLDRLDLVAVLKTRE